MKQTAVLHSVAFLRRPSSETVRTVRKLAGSRDPDVRASALLALGSLARYSSESTSDSITDYLVHQLIDVQHSSSTEERRFVSVVLHALGNARNPEAAAAILDFTRRSKNKETQMVAVKALKYYLELISVIDNLTALVMSRESVADVVAVVLIDLLTEQLKQRLPAKIPHLQQLESALHDRAKSSPLLEPLFSQYSRLRGESNTSPSKTTETVSGSGQVSTGRKFSDVKSFRDRRSSYQPLSVSYSGTKTLGVDKLNLGFAIDASGTLDTMAKVGKVSAKASASCYAFGYSATAVDIDFEVFLSNTSASYRGFIELAGTVVLEEGWGIDLCQPNSITLLPSRNALLFDRTFRVPVLATTLSFALSASIDYSVTGSYNICPRSLKGDISANGYFTAAGGVGLINILVRLQLT